MSPMEQYKSFLNQKEEQEKKEEKKGKRLWWLKLPKDFFTSNAVIKKMRKLPGGDTYVVITLKLLLLSLDHDFRIYYEGVEDTFAKDIALTLDESAEAVDVTLRLLLQQGWLVEESAEILMSPKSQELAGSESESAKRVRDYRERIKNKETAYLPLHCNKNVTLEKRREEIEREKKREDPRREETPASMNDADLTALCPEAFESGSEKASPTLEEVKAFSSAAGIQLLPPELFLSHFSSEGWLVKGKPITDWRILYATLENLGRKRIAEMPFPFERIERATDAPEAFGQENIRRG